MTAKLHVDAADLAAIDPDDPALQGKVGELVDCALTLGGNPATALCLILAAIGTIAARTDRRAGVLGVAWQMIDEEVGEAHADMRRELRATDSDSNGDPS